LPPTRRPTGSRRLTSCSDPNYIQDLLALKAAPASDIAYLQKHGAQVANAATHNASRWKDWYWICFGGMIFFLGTVPLMRGRWSPKQARADEQAHEAMVQAELAKLHATA
jgi:hypothetical protein